MKYHKIYSDFDKSYVVAELSGIFSKTFFLEWMSKEHSKFVSYGLNIKLSNKPKWLKKEMIDVLFIIFNKKDLFRSFLTLMDEATIKSLKDVSWYGRLPHNEVNISSSWTWLFKKHTAYCESYNLPYFIKENIKRFMPAPVSFNLKGQDEPGETEYQFLFKTNHIKDILAFTQALQQNTISFSSSKEIPIQSTLKKFYKKFPYQEFYPVDDKVRAPYHRAYCIFLYLNKFSLGSSPTETSSPIDFIKKAVEYPAQKRLNSDIPIWTSYLKGNGRHVFNDNASLEIINLFKCLPKKKWINIQDIIGWTTINKKPLDITESRSGYPLQFKKKSTYSYDKIYINPNNREQLLILPLLKSRCFLFASLGLLDIAYNTPSNLYYRSDGKEYLTMFDGLSWVRLTSLGEYVFGQAKEKPNIKISGSPVELDNNVLIATLKHSDPIKQFYLESIGIKISENQYKIDNSSLIKSCSSLEDLQSKKDIFLEIIQKDPPEKWISLFDNAIEKFNILKGVNYHVFEIKKDLPFLHIVKSDHILINLIKFAENGFVIINHSDIKKARERLRELGYYF